jgi:transposase InsO family protein
MGIRDKPIAPRSPWQNGLAERLIGSIRRECADHVVAMGEGHLRQLLQSYARYYNEWMTHCSLNKDAPGHRPREPRVPSFHGRFSVDFTTNIAESDFRYTQPAQHV